LDLGEEDTPIDGNEEDEEENNDEMKKGEVHRV